MDLKEHTTPAKLEQYAFQWSIARMVIAAASLFLGAGPIAVKILGYSTTWSYISFFWLISGVAAGYLGYLWYIGDQKVFGGNDQKDKVAFLIMVITGINLGLVALINNNVGMSFFDTMPIGDLLFKVTAVIYLLVAWHLWTRWNACL